jgi:hypothetical protein
MFPYLDWCYLLLRPICARSAQLATGGRYEQALDMEDSAESRSSRYLALIAVIAIHAALVIALLSASSHRIFLFSQIDPVEVSFLPPNTLPKGSPLSALMLPPDRHIPPLSGSDSMIVVPPPSSPENKQPGRDVDWEEEARQAAEVVVDDNNIPAAADKPGSASASPSWFAPPLHHAGDQFRSDTGEWVVWINDHCYQVSEWGPIAGATLGASLPRTICPQPSSTARGDLFRDLLDY